VAGKNRPNRAATRDITSNGATVQHGRDLAVSEVLSHARACLVSFGFRHGQTEARRHGLGKGGLRWSA
jgi:hypothetical protein